ncbi:hypothetical protein ABB31_04315 [Stenotrophomonas pavanii]|nr:hypothetical protein ABB31_04315 [Stenotrophomonas pavanii]
MRASADMSPVYGGKQHRDHSADSSVGVVGTDGGEVHSLRETDDLCHGINVAPAATCFPTMIDCAFQGGS